MGHEKELRRNMTLPERILWYAMRDRRFFGHKIRRQSPRGPYILDFVCLERRLVIEVDGGQHADNPADVERDAWLRAHGFRVLRIWNHEVLKNLDGVLETIERELGAAAGESPHLAHSGLSSPPPGRGI